jgi:NAD(P)-dependent dehydrogenase (short-subunit alcohol dehydrogenase family)
MEMDLQMTGKVVFQTGAGGRLGRAIALAFAREGAKVAVADMNEQAAAATVDALVAGGAEAVAVVGDVSLKADVERMLEQATNALGPVDVLVNGHGIFPNIPMLETTVDEWDRIFAINTRGTMLTCQAVANQMIARGAQGAIVNVSSGAATSARIGGAGYCGSKAAVNLLTHAFAIEVGPHGIRVNAVAPGLIMDTVLRPGDEHAAGYVNMMLQGTPMRRTGAPEDIAEAILFLAAERNSWVTGSILEVTGGSHCGRPHVPLSRNLR